ncbi:MAG TPA: type II toxin-antitoxin system MqsA family antitoxin [Ktedonobacteraceae bacterium]|nr:type II toxin-antitoxin system MqsA family antitoxin [Ktedonobacteraceae bacterium]
MRCVMCKDEGTSLGTTTVTLERNAKTVVFKHVPAQVCENCGEAYIDVEVTRQLLQVIEEAARGGVQVDVRQFIAA